MRSTPVARGSRAMSGYDQVQYDDVWNGSAPRAARRRRAAGEALILELQRLQPGIRARRLERAADAAAAPSIANGRPTRQRHAPPRAKKPRKRGMGRVIELALNNSALPPRSRRRSHEPTSRPNSPSKAARRRPRQDRAATRQRHATCPAVEYRWICQSPGQPFRPSGRCRHLYRQGAARVALQRCRRNQRPAHASDTWSDKAAPIEPARLPARREDAGADQAIV